MNEAKALGASTELHFVDLPLVELQRRVAERNKALPSNTFHIDAGDLEDWSDQFERPSADELKRL